MGIYQVSSKSVGNYIGQFRNKKRHGVGMLVLYSPESDRNTIIEGQFEENIL